MTFFPDKDTESTKYGGFRFIGWLLRFAGYGSAGAAIIVITLRAAVAIGKGDDPDIIAPLAAFVGALITVAIAEAAFVLMDIEANTRRTS